MKLDFFGGFGESGRVCIGIASAKSRIIVDAGIRSSGGSDSYYPQIPAAYLNRTDAIIITHAHEDHIGAVGHCVANGFNGRFFMARETFAEAAATVAAYGARDEAAAFATATVVTIQPAARFRIGEFEIDTGRSGHAVGGVWVAVNDGHSKIVHCGDIVPASPVLAMDAIPPCDVLIIDASYGDDEVSVGARADDIRAWVTKTGSCLLPTPLIGRSLELLALLEDPPAIHADMRCGLKEQLRAGAWFQPGMGQRLRETLAQSEDWRPGRPWPDSVLLTDDGMGLGGPSRDVIPCAVSDGIALLGTGHLPLGSPLQQLHGAGRASWHRLPTHPTMVENIELVQATNPKLVLAHSCRYSAMPRLIRALPKLDATVATGQSLDL